MLDKEMSYVVLVVVDEKSDRRKGEAVTNHVGTHMKSIKSRFLYRARHRS